jgi:hypothetical protein
MGQRMTTTTSALGLALLAFGAARCGYAPSFEGGKLTCSNDVNNRCPDGYECLPDNKCWKEGAAGSAGSSGTAGASGAAGASGTAGSSGTAGLGAIKVIGHWIFDAASTSTVTCGATVSPPTSLKDDFVDIVEGTAARTVVASYYCGWVLDVGPAGTTTTMRANQTCNTTDDMSGNMFTWKGTTFSFTSTDGVSATLASMIATTVKQKDGTTNNCTVKLTGRLAK